MTCQDMSCTYDSSGGAFPDGYCIWESSSMGWLPISCHCKKGYCCGDGPGTMRRPSGQLLKWPCRLREKHAHEQQQ